MNRAGRPSLPNNPKAWSDSFVAGVVNSIQYGSYEDVAYYEKELQRKLKQEYTRGYQAAKRPVMVPCNWCGKGVELGKVHMECAATRQRASHGV